MCDEIQSEDGKKGFIIRYPEMILPNNDRYMENEKIKIIELHKALNSIEFLNSSHVVIFLTESLKNINNLFLNSNSRTTGIEITLPDYQARLDFIKKSLSPRQYR